MKFHEMEKEYYDYYVNSLFHIYCINTYGYLKNIDEFERYISKWEIQFLNFAKSTNSSVLFALEDDVITGYCMYSLDLGTLYINDVQLFPENQGRGALRQISSYIVSHLDTAEPSYVRVAVNVDDLKTIKICRHIGFRTERENHAKLYLVIDFVDYKKWINKC